ncbi:hypothetical protein [Agromyces larvae]|uniref:Uncharacterized protein n=1 Tax=Agromyces larvae TaxID=2929802 RepID=A0ABY4C400_9MICO|nr:hypothetical protein [Agromyces larvae]UOE45939.1 hypothetical protein MTO99_09420 [Agromyces larvae]
MTPFSSGRHARLTADPHPWIERTSSRYLTADAYYSGEPREFRPRPEFDRPLTNPANPIRREYRASLAADIPYTDPESWLANLDSLEPGSDAWKWRDEPDTLDHAERVLTRLAALTTTPKEN